MLYEPFMLNMVWKSTERYFGNLSLEKYGILKWKMCRNPDRRPLKHFDASTVQVTVRMTFTRNKCKRSHKNNKSVIFIHPHVVLTPYMFLWNTKYFHAYFLPNSIQSIIKITIYCPSDYFKSYTSFLWDTILICYSLKVFFKEVFPLNNYHYYYQSLLYNYKISVCS